VTASEVYQNDVGLSIGLGDAWEDDTALESGELGLELQGGRLRFQVPIESGNRKGGGIRGAVFGMSEASRRRFMQKFASCDFESLGETPVYFLTLTTPECFWEASRSVQEALTRFRKRLEYAFLPSGYLGAFVRRELGGKRGMLHYHLVVVGGKGVTRKWVRRAWTDCLRYENGLVRCDSELVDSAERVSKYLAKYCSKAAYEGSSRGSASEGASLSKAHNWRKPPFGRWWFIWGAERLPWADRVVIRGEDARQIAKRVKRLYRRWRVQKFRERVLGESPEARAAFGNKSLKWWATRAEMRFCESLRRSGGGCNICLSPALLNQMVDAASLSYIDMGGEPIPF